MTGKAERDDFDLELEKMLAGEADVESESGTAPPEGGAEEPENPGDSPRAPDAP